MRCAWIHIKLHRSVEFSVDDEKDAFKHLCTATVARLFNNAIVLKLQYLIGEQQSSPPEFVMYAKDQSPIIPYQKSPGVVASFDVVKSRADIHKARSSPTRVHSPDLRESITRSSRALKDKVKKLSNLDRECDPLVGFPFGGFTWSYEKISLRLIAPILILLLIYLA